MKQAREGFARLIRFTVLCSIVLCSTSATGIQEEHSDASPEVRVYIDISSKKYFSGQPTPEPFRRLKSLLKRSGVTYDIVYMPWGRALANIHNDRNSLIYQLLRTPDRENEYIWLMEATDAEPMKLVGRKGLNERVLFDDIKAGKYTAACYMDSAQCDLLVDFGFREGNLLRTSKHVLYHLEALLANGRVDFIPVFESSLEDGLNKTGELVDNYQSYAVLDRSVDYLAGVKGQVDTDIVNRLKAAAKQVNE